VASTADLVLVGGPAEDRPTGASTYATAPPPAARRVEYDLGAGGFKAGRSSQVNDARRVINHTEDPSLVSRVTGGANTARRITHHTADPRVLRDAASPGRDAPPPLLPGPWRESLSAPASAADTASGSDGRGPPSDGPPSDRQYEPYSEPYPEPQQGPSGSTQRGAIGGGGGGGGGVAGRGGDSPQGTAGLRESCMCVCLCVLNDQLAYQATSEQK